MPNVNQRNQPTQTPPLRRPNQPSLAEIVKDLQKRVARLESRQDTH